MEQINTYFNKDLRRVIGYPESFQVEYLLEKHRIILTPYKPSQLLQMIIKNPELKERMLRILFTLILRIDPNIHTPWFTSHGNDIVINWTLTGGLYELDTGLYSIIYSYLDPVDVNRLCVALPDICDSTVFWTELIRFSYPEYLKPTKLWYDWKDLYFQLSQYTYLLKRGIQPTPGSLGRDFAFVLKLLLETRQIKTSLLKGQKELIKLSIKNDDYELFRLLLPYVFEGKDKQEVYVEIMSISKLSDKLFDELYEYSHGKPNPLHKLLDYLNIDLKKIYGQSETFSYIIDHNKIKLSSEVKGKLVELLSHNNGQNEEMLKLRLIVNELLADLDPNIIDININIKNNLITISYSNPKLLKDILYNYIISRFTEDEFNRGKDGEGDVFDQFDTYDDFKDFQKRVLSRASLKKLNFYEYLMKKIRSGTLSNMNDESMIVMSTLGFFFLNDDGKDDIVILNLR